MKKMVSLSPRDSKSALGVSVQGLAVQAVLSIALLGSAFSSKSLLVWMIFFTASAGLPVWACVWFLNRIIHKRSVREARAAEQTTTSATPDSPRKIQRLYCAAAILTSMSTGLYMAAQAVFLFRPGILGPAADSLVGNRDPLVGLLVAGGLTFVGFFGAYYLLELAGDRKYRMIKAGVGYLILCVVFTALTAIAFGFAVFRIYIPFEWLKSVFPFFAAVIGAETLFFSFIEMYRPRRTHEFPRPAFDSRLLRILSSPHSTRVILADTINYQFGFNVSQNWFIQLTGKLMLPVALFSCVLIWLLSAVVIVEEGKQAVVIRFGQIRKPVLESGLHFKAPWPFSTAVICDVRRIRKAHVGSHTPSSPVQNIFKKGVPVLWTNMHGIEPEEMLIVAPPRHLELPPALRKKTRAPSVSLIGCDIYVEYRIRDLLQFLTSHRNSSAHFRCMAEKKASRFLLRYDVDTLLSVGRAEAGTELKTLLQKSADRSGLGIDVMHVGFIGVHPPQQIAQAFHETVAAEQVREMTIQRALQFQSKTLAETAGTLELAKQLISELDRLEKLQSENASESRIHAVQTDIEKTFRIAEGNVAKNIAMARAYRWIRENDERAKAERFVKQLAIYRISPTMYQMGYYLTTLLNGLEKARKYVILSEQQNLLFRFNHSSGVTPPQNEQIKRVIEDPDYDK